MNTDAKTGSVILVGRTQSGGKFRPSDWAQRLAISVATVGGMRQLIFHPRVHTVMHEGFASVVVDQLLEAENQMMYEFFLKFARDNDLELVYREG